MKVTVCFDSVRVVVPCGDGTLLVRDLMHEAILRYRKATGRTDPGPAITSLSSLTGGGLLDPDDRLCDVADDREQIVAHFSGNEVPHVGGDGASSVGTNSPDFFHHHVDVHGRVSSGMRRESKRLSMHATSTREPSQTTYSASSLPRESRRREPLGQDAKAAFELSNKSEASSMMRDEIREIVIKNDAGPLGIHWLPCHDLSGDDQGLRVEGIEPNGRIGKDGQIDLHDKIIKINGHSLLRIPYNKVEEIFRSCMTEPCLRISVVKSRKNLEKMGPKGLPDKSDEAADSRRLQCSTYHLLQNANTRKIGRIIEIELTKGSEPLGFSVTTRDNPAGGHCPIYIKNILPRGPAVEDGRLRPGDRLLEVNNVEMTGKSQDDVVSLLRSIPPGGKVRITVSRQEDVPSTETTEVTPDKPICQEMRFSPKKAVPKEESPPTTPFKVPLDDVVLSPRKNRMILTLDIPVHDSEKAGLGVSVKGKTSSTDDNSSMDLGIFIKSVLNGGAASRDGRLRTNDQLLNVNGKSLLGLSNSKAMETLRSAMLNTNSSVTGVITLTIARRVSPSYDNCDGIGKIETANSIYVLDEGKSDKNGVNQEIVDEGMLPSSSSPWNPVIDRLTEQYNKNSLRNESYCLATNKTWIEGKKVAIGEQELLLEESSENPEEKKSDERDSHYDSQLSLEEFNSAKFSRDALGRQSMSEKRHAALDAKNTDTYKRNKKIREGREKESQEGQEKKEEEREVREEKGESSFEAARKKFERFEKNSEAKAEYIYTIPGCNSKYISPRKHWLVDEGHGNVSNGQFKEEGEGFSNSRGDVKQASLNSALDERYKRSRKKGGIRSMLRLGKNRKSLNFGDNIEGRHETSNYCSGTINYIA
ncbi:partitioning defective 3 homolog [Fopius arisanus]|uniref:Pard3b protein n=1 Tax=Fopius arisanus TaxID=64838 RepID=A0A0C9QBB3_9HYME|nr:PREDICTED: partitioning defective 3 homolog [Fopius arisanus]